MSALRASASASRAAPTRRAWSRRTWWRSQRQVARLGILALLPIVSLTFGASAQQLVAEPRAIKAVILRSLPRYVTWPAQSLPNATAPWQICILGRDPFGAVLEATLRGRSEQGRAFELRRAVSIDALPACQIAYIGYSDANQRRQALATVKGKPVLTVSDAPDFLQEGGIIRFGEAERIQISVNLDQARAASLGVQSKMLEVAYEVLDNGRVRRPR